MVAERNPRKRSASREMSHAKSLASHGVAARWFANLQFHEQCERRDARAGDHVPVPVEPHHAHVIARDLEPDRRMAVVPTVDGVGVADWGSS